ncbi:MAG: hypothetical protein J3R72DRAFT_444212 [Linnemannia gamsii]|nr:MAG: hypothetical protein J3R72DRAFT_444212 [Linnemannia gamsii]
MRLASREGGQTLLLQLAGVAVAVVVDRVCMRVRVGARVVGMNCGSSVHYSKEGGGREGDKVEMKMNDGWC